jgi:hypothetical protein
LLRIGVYIPQQVEELFQVNVAKKHAVLPRDLRIQMLKSIQHAIHLAQEVYREKGASINPSTAPRDAFKTNNKSEGPTQNQNLEPIDFSHQRFKGIQTLIKQVVDCGKFRTEHQKAEELLIDIFKETTKIEAHNFEQLLLRFTSKSRLQ